MGNRDLRAITEVKSLIAPVALTADNTPALIDIRGYESVKIVVVVGIGGITFTGTNKIEFKISDSTDGTSTTAVAMAAA
jgi:hypothetical protein